MKQNKWPFQSINLSTVGLVNVYQLYWTRERAPNIGFLGSPSPFSLVSTSFLFVSLLNATKALAFENICTQPSQQHKSHFFTITRAYFWSWFINLFHMWICTSFHISSETLWIQVMESRECGLILSQIYCDTLNILAFRLENGWAVCVIIKQIVSTHYWVSVTFQLSKFIETGLSNQKIQLVVDFRENIFWIYVDKNKTLGKCSMNLFQSLNANCWDGKIEVVHSCSFNWKFYFIRLMANRQYRFNTKPSLSWKERSRDKRWDDHTNWTERETLHFTFFQFEPKTFLWR